MKCGVLVGKIECIYKIRLFPVVFIFVCKYFTSISHTLKGNKTISIFNMGIVFFYIEIALSFCIIMR